MGKGYVPCPCFTLWSSLFNSPNEHRSDIVLHSTKGVSLICNPVLHDIYSCERGAIWYDRRSSGPPNSVKERRSHPTLFC